MNFIKNNIWTILSLVVVMVLTMAGDASAQTITTNPSIETIAKDKAASVFVAARNVMFIVGGFGLVAIAFAAIAGKMPWKWVGSLAIGLAIIAAASAVINYAISDSGTEQVKFGDTLS